MRWGEMTTSSRPAEQSRDLREIPDRKWIFDLWLSRTPRRFHRGGGGAVRSSIKQFQGDQLFKPGDAMYPIIPAELLTGAVELVVCLFTMIAVFISMSLTSRG